jgi:hypothetical protein
MANKVKRVEVPVVLIKIKPFLNLTISLRMIDNTKNLLNTLFFQKVLKKMISLPLFVSLVSVELGSMVTDALGYPSYTWTCRLPKDSFRSRTEFSAKALSNSPPETIFFEASSKTSHTCLPGTALLM